MAVCTLNPHPSSRPASKLMWLPNINNLSFHGKAGGGSTNNASPGWEQAQSRRDTTKGKRREGGGGGGEEAKGGYCFIRSHVAMWLDVEMWGNLGGGRRALLKRHRWLWPGITLSAGHGCIEARRMGNWGLTTYGVIVEKIPNVSRDTGYFASQGWVVGWQLVAGCSREMPHV